MAVLEDRKSTKPGRMLIKPESGSAEFYATLEMADEPVREGIKISAQNVIDTLLPVSENGGAGTVIFSAVQSPDDRWLICDGSEVKKAEYPELYKVLPEVALRPSSVKTVTVDGTTGVVKRMKYINGYYVFVANGKVFYSRNLYSGWQQGEQIGATTSAALWDISYANGYWVALLVDEIGKYDGPCIYYAQSPGGSWTRAWYLSDYANCFPLKIGFEEDGVWRAYFFMDGKIQIMKSTNMTTWTQELCQQALPNDDWRVVYAEYCNSRKRWEVIAYCSTDRLYSLYHSENLREWEQVGADIKPADYTADSTDNVYSACLGIGEEYWNLATAKNVIHLSPQGEVAEVVTLPYSGNPLIVCDGTREFLCEKTHNYTRTVGEEFAELNVVTLPCNYAWRLSKLSTGEWVLGTYSTTDFYTFDGGLSQCYRPEITVADLSGVTRAYIKAK